jgi:hypothetical protein
MKRLELVTNIVTKKRYINHNKAKELALKNHEKPFCETNSHAMKN